MKIAETVREREVVDYDFMFLGGTKLTITVDAVAGDTVREFGDRYIINTTERKGLTPEDDVSAEELILFKGHLAVLGICKRLQRLPTEEELFNMRKTLHTLAKGVQ